MKDSIHGELERPTMKMVSDVQKISKGDKDHQNIKRNSPLTGNNIAEHKQTSTVIGGPSNW
uniref:Uncharacterized protein n=1 Tax=Arundo donax TaxID=35708 RepID=A0A0A9A2I3_ARUDO